MSYHNTTGADSGIGVRLIFWPTLLATASVFLIILSFFSGTQLGIRHILAVLVIFAILSGGAFSDWAKFSLRWKFLLTGCLLYVAVSVGSYFPHMIPYFNETLTDRKQAYHFLADSNLDWGQDAWVVQRFLKSNPDVILDPRQPVTDGFWSAPISWPACSPKRPITP